MFAISKKATALLAVGAAFALPAAAEMSAADIAKLGTTLTPVGAEKAGNAAGTIPAWDGGITKPVAGYKPGGQYPDPFPNDKPLFTIDGEPTRTSTRTSSPPGQVAMLKKYPDYKMIVYPTRRSAVVPDVPLQRDQGVRRQGEARPRRQRRGGLHRRHPVPDPEGRQRGDLELDCCATAATPSRRTGPRPPSRAPATTRS